uniref:Uncharacterized protein n=1 Tax=Cacopsylla melanoneura TaxID=428564 RepID=A0A8D8QVC6_9HEMI
MKENKYYVLEKEAADNIAENRNEVKSEGGALKQEDTDGISLDINGSNEAHEDEKVDEKVEINSINEGVSTKKEEIYSDEKGIDTKNERLNISNGETTTNNEETDIKTEELNSNNEEETNMRIGVARKMKEVGGGD